MQALNSSNPLCVCAPFIWTHLVGGGGGDDGAAECDDNRGFFGGVRGNVDISYNMQPNESNAKPANLVFIAQIAQQFNY